jgi:hypothetical protein
MLEILAAGQKAAANHNKCEQPPQHGLKRYIQAVVTPAVESDVNASYVTGHNVVRPDSAPPVEFLGRFSHRTRVIAAEVGLAGTVALTACTGGNSEEIQQTEATTPGNQPWIDQELLYPIELQKVTDPERMKTHAASFAELMRTNFIDPTDSSYFGNPAFWSLVSRVEAGTPDEIASHLRVTQEITTDEHGQVVDLTTNYGFVIDPTQDVTYSPAIEISIGKEPKSTSSNGGYLTTINGQVDREGNFTSIDDTFVPNMQSYWDTPDMPKIAAGIFADQPAAWDVKTNITGTAIIGESTNGASHKKISFYSRGSFSVRTLYTSGESLPTIVVAPPAPEEGNVIKSRDCYYAEGAVFNAGRDENNSQDLADAQLAQITPTDLRQLAKYAVGEARGSYAVSNAQDASNISDFQADEAIVNRINNGEIRGRAEDALDFVEAEEALSNAQSSGLIDEVRQYADLVENSIIEEKVNAALIGVFRAAFGSADERAAAKQTLSDTQEELDDQANSAADNFVVTAYRAKSKMAAAC